MVMRRLSEPSPYVEFDRRQWRALRMSTPLPLTEAEVVALRGLGEQVDLLEVEEVYLPLARLIHLQVAARQLPHPFYCCPKNAAHFLSLTW